MPAPYKDGVYVISQRDVGEGQLFDGNMRSVSGVKAGEMVVKSVSSLRLQAGPFVYAATPEGLIMGADSSLFSTPAKMREFCPTPPRLPTSCAQNSLSRPPRRPPKNRLP